jgi:hypothetical protein
MTTREVVATVRVSIEIDEDNSYLDEEIQIERALAEFTSDVLSIESVS